VKLLYAHIELLHVSANHVAVLRDTNTKVRYIEIPKWNYKISEPTHTFSV